MSSIDQIKKEGSRIEKTVRKLKACNPAFACRKVVEVCSNWPSYSVLTGSQSSIEKTVVKKENR
jgi:hypothetical protein